jgi:hypothetical protein
MQKKIRVTPKTKKIMPAVPKTTSFPIVGIGASAGGLEAYVRYEDLPLKTADGRRIEVEFVSNVYTVDHQKVIQCNIRAITDRKQTEEALNEYQ